MRERISGESEVAQEPNDAPTMGIDEVIEDGAVGAEGSGRTKKDFGVQGFGGFDNCVCSEGKEVPGLVRARTEG